MKIKKKAVGVKGSSKLDWLSNLPESLLCKILMNLPTKDVVKCSVLSKRWRNLWGYVQCFDLDEEDFQDTKTFASFVDAFLGFNSDLYLESFKLKYFGYDDDDGNSADVGVVSRWINTVVDRRVKHLNVWFFDDGNPRDIQMPPNLYTCESLVSLKLDDVHLGSPKFVSLPSLKVMDLAYLHLEDNLDLETLISGCPVLESLFINRNVSEDDLKVLRVCSQSLLSFTHVCDGVLNPLIPDIFVVAVSAPRLQYLRLGDDWNKSYILNDTSSLVEAYIDTVFNRSFEHNFENDLEKRKMIHSVLKGISCVKDMTITSKTLEVIYQYSRCEQLPIFRSLTTLRVIFANYRWEMLPIFLESCPNLKSLVVVSRDYPKKEGTSILSGPQCLLSSLEYVDIKRPLKGEVMEMKLLSYFLEKSAILKKLTICFESSMRRKKESAIFKELLTIPRLSSSCQVVVL